jgi:hypothetical protein
MPFTIFGTAILYLFLADRTSVFLKEQKQYNVWTFTVLVLVSLAIGLATTVKRDKDMGFLNREQTDEWKGWMQSEFTRIWISEEPDAYHKFADSCDLDLPLLWSVQGFRNL